MKKIVLGLSLFVLLLAAGLGAMTAGESGAEAALTELSIEKMTCGACVGTISDALAKLDGVEQVDIVVTTGRGQVLYNPERVDAQTIAKTVTESGYPAEVQLELSSSDYRALQAEESRLAEDYLAKIGTRLISRKSFDERLERALATMQIGSSPEAVQQVRISLWQDLVDREILLAAAERNQVVVQQGEVDYRVEQLRKTTADFDATVLPGYGGQEQFMKRVKEDMIINRNIEDHVIAGLDNPLEKRQKVNQWYQQLVQETPVVIFDKQFKQLASGAASGCGSGGGCCSS